MIQIYTGDGKGKTTAALGLTLRATGAGMRVYFGQFIKTGGTSEEKCLKAAFPNVVFEPYGGGFVRGQATPKQKQEASEGLKRALSALNSGAYDLVILDEINVAVRLGLVGEAEALDLMRACPKTVELVMTGRGATQAMMDMADLVTEMRCVKHYFKQGVAARTGIEE